MQQFDHHVIRLLVGVISIFMPLVLYLVAYGIPLTSISQSYHLRPTHDLFVGLLFAIAALFSSFSDDEASVRRLPVLASLLAVLIAVAPCADAGAITWLSATHYLAAVMLFSILGYYCWRFRNKAREKFKERRFPETRRREYVYVLCLVGIIVCVLGSLAMAAFARFDVNAVEARWPTYVFCLEALGLISFGCSWFIASRILPWFTNKEERIRFKNGKAS
jgi:cytochrome c biogenesis factor